MQKQYLLYTLQNVVGEREVDASTLPMLQLRPLLSVGQEGCCQLLALEFGPFAS